MKSKPKFRPKITRVKLNPEQAVLACSCYANLLQLSFFSYDSAGTYCTKGGNLFGAHVVFGASSS